MWNDRKRALGDTRTMNMGPYMKRDWQTIHVVRDGNITCQRSKNPRNTEHTQQHDYRLNWYWNANGENILGKKFENVGPESVVFFEVSKFVDFHSSQSNEFIWMTSKSKIKKRLVDRQTQMKHKIQICQRRKKSLSILKLSWTTQDLVVTCVMGMKKPSDENMKFGEVGLEPVGFFPK